MSGLPLPYAAADSMDPRLASLHSPSLPDDDDDDAQHFLLPPTLAVSEAGVSHMVSEFDEDSPGPSSHRGSFGGSDTPPLAIPQSGFMRTRSAAAFDPGTSGGRSRMESGADIGKKKGLATEALLSRHEFKTKLAKYESYLDRALALMHIGTSDAILEGEVVVSKVMSKAWVNPSIGRELAYSLCDYMRESGIFEAVVRAFVHPGTTPAVRIGAGKALEESMSAKNRRFIVDKNFLEPLVRCAMELSERGVDCGGSGDPPRIAMSLMESLFKCSPEVSLRLIELGVLDFILAAISNTTPSPVHKHAALALANLSMYSDNECQQKMITKKVQDWLFLLASMQDGITRYYACFAICTLVSNKEIEASVTKSGTLALVEPFLLANKPEHFAISDYRHSQGRPKEWLEGLVPMLSAKRREARSLAAYHFAMEAGIKRQQDNTTIFQEIGSIECLKAVASSPDEVPSKFARMALRIIGEEIPYKLSHQVPLWTVQDVQYWICKIGFKDFAAAFEEQMVDGDLLLLLSDEELRDDIGMVSRLLRKRFRRELDSLKVAADYSCIDETQMDRVLMSASPCLSIYTYKLLEMGVDTNQLPLLSDDMLASVCGIGNPIHRRQILQVGQECAHAEDMELTILRKHIDVFISYRRSTGNQLASLIKVLLQLRGHKVFIDVDRLYAGKFDSSLLKNIQAASHFILVLTPLSMDRLLDDGECEDWVHKEIRCAIDHHRNVIPVFDPSFQWPEESRIPPDVRAITRFNGVRWVHEYQEACVDKLERFISGDLKGTSVPNAALSLPASPRKLPGASRTPSRAPSLSPPILPAGKTP